MPRSILVAAGILTLISAIIFYFINYTVSVGLLVGYLFSLIYIGMLTFSYTSMVQEASNKILVVLSVLLRLFVLAFPMLLACLMPEYLNLFGVFFGLIMFKISLYLSIFFKKGGF